MQPQNDVAIRIAEIPPTQNNFRNPFILLRPLEKLPELAFG